MHCKISTLSLSFSLLLSTITYPMNKKEDYDFNLAKTKALIAQAITLHIKAKSAQGPYFLAHFLEDFDSNYRADVKEIHQRYAATNNVCVCNEFKNLTVAEAEELFKDIIKKNLERLEKHHWVAFTLVKDIVFDKFCATVSDRIYQTARDWGFLLRETKCVDLEIKPSFMSPILKKYTKSVLYKCHKKHLSKQC